MCACGGTRSPRSVQACRDALGGVERGGGAERGRDQLALLKEVDEDVESSIGRLGVPSEVLGQLLESKGLRLDSNLGV